MAWRAVSTLVDTTVAMALAESWKPFMYSKISAMTMTAMSRDRSMEPLPFFRDAAGGAAAPPRAPGGAGGQLCLRTMLTITSEMIELMSSAFSIPL